MQRGRDSNPRYGFPYTHFPGVLLQPLGHLSVSLSGAAKLAIPRLFSEYFQGICRSNGGYFLQRTLAYFT